MGERCLYMGSWGGPGMYLWVPGGRHAPEGLHLIEYYRKRELHLDSTLAPRLMKPMYGRPGGRLIWEGQGLTREERQHLHYSSEECPQGQFLRHELDNGFTAVSWWDRTQGDARGAINSTVLLEGVRTSEEVLAAGRASFPIVFENLRKSGIELVELFLP